MYEKIQNYRTAPAIYLYGSGCFGQSVYAEMTKLGYDNIVGFIDTTRSDPDFLPIPMLSINTYLSVKRKNDDIIIISSSYSEEIKDEILRRGIIDGVLTHHEFISAHLITTLTNDFSKFRNIGDDNSHMIPLSTSFFERMLRPRHSAMFWGDRLITFDKSNGFLDDLSLMNAYAEIWPEGSRDEYGAPGGIVMRLNTLLWAARNALRLDGDFVECGVLHGDMSWIVVKATQFTDSEKDFYLYDSFGGGFSEKHSSPDDFPDNPDFFNFIQQHYKKTSYDAVRKRFSNWPQIKVIKGHLPDTLEIEKPEKIAYLHIDLNSPSAEVGVLETLFDRVVPGGFIVLDDYGWKVFRKQKEQEDAFMAARGYQILELPTGQGLVVKR